MAGPEFDKSDPRLALIESKLRSYPDFPKKGILFYDLFSVLGDAEGLAAVVSVIKDVAASYRGKVDVVVGLDARGFLYAPIMAAELGVPFVPIRKKGKLPGDCAETSFDLEYGSATFAIQRDAVAEGQRILIVDDLLATGGTLKAACDLVLGLKASIAGSFVMIELNIGGREKVSGLTELRSLFKYQ